MRRAQGLDTPGTLAQVLDHLGYIQIDPINICGRMHDLILRPRVRDYREGGLIRRLHARDRLGFEQYLPDDRVLVAFPMDAYPYLVPSMEKRKRLSGYHGRLEGEERSLARDILDRIRTDGPLESAQIDHAGRATTGWGTRGRLVKTTLEKLFAQGEVLIHGRRHFRRIYDLPERVIPRDVLARPVPGEDERARWRIRLKLRQRRLARLSAVEARVAIDFAFPVQIDDGPVVWCLRDDRPLLENAVEENGSRRRPTTFLAPLDPLIYDRSLTERLWNFDYRWEVYTPAHKRVRGYYALPVLSGLRLVGHVEPRVARKEGRLNLDGCGLDSTVAIDRAMRSLARFLEVEYIGD